MKESGAVLASFDVAIGSYGKTVTAAILMLERAANMAVEKADP
jgi:hypothetical protein